MTIRSAVIAAAMGSTLIASRNLSAQEAGARTVPQTKSRWEFLALSGTLVPTGSERDVLKRADVSAAQLSFLVRPAVALTSTIGWARSRDVSIGDNPKLDVFTYDVGAEVRAPGRNLGESFSIAPFAGTGVGGRSYNYRKLDVDATHNLAAYGSVGGALGIRRVQVRIEARDYVAGFKPLNGSGAARTGNDVVVMAGLRLVAR